MNFGLLDMSAWPYIRKMALSKNYTGVVINPGSNFTLIGVVLRIGDFNGDRSLRDSFFDNSGKGNISIYALPEMIKAGYVIMLLDQTTISYAENYHFIKHRQFQIAYISEVGDYVLSSYKCFVDNNIHENIKCILDKSEFKFAQGA